MAASAGQVFSGLTVVDEPEQKPHVGEGWLNSEKTMDEILLAKHDPFRRPNWRWRLAERLFREGRRSHGVTDADVAAAIRYRRRLAGCERTRERAAAEAPDLHAAHLIYQEGGPRAWVIEARLLAGCSIRDVADGLGIEAGHVRAYRSLFWDVHLTAIDWVRDTILRPSRSQDPAERCCWHWAAWYAGTVPLELLVDSYHERLDDRHQALADALRLLVQSWILPIADHEAALNLLRRGRELLAAYDEDGREAMPMDEITQLMLATPLLLTKTAPKTDASSRRTRRTSEEVATPSEPAAEAEPPDSEKTDGSTAPETANDDRGTDDEAPAAAA